MEPRAKLPSFHRQRYQMYFLERNGWHFDSISPWFIPEVCGSIVQNNVLALNMWQAITWTNDDRVQDFVAPSEVTRQSFLFCFVGVFCGFFFKSLTNRLIREQKSLFAVSHTLYLICHYLPRNRISMTIFNFHIVSMLDKVEPGRL